MDAQQMALQTAALERIAKALEFANELRIISLSAEQKAQLQAHGLAKAKAQGRVAPGNVLKTGDTPR